MNAILEQFARDFIAQGLGRCTPDQQNLFRRIYAFDKPELSIEEIAQTMPMGNLSTAMKQIDYTLKKNVRPRLDQAT